jgi:hypothetical protein
MLLALSCVRVPLAENSLKFNISDGSILLIIRWVPCRSRRAMSLTDPNAEAPRGPLSRRIRGMADVKWRRSIYEYTPSAAARCRPAVDQAVECAQSRVWTGGSLLPERGGFGAG